MNQNYLEKKSKELRKKQKILGIIFDNHKNSL